MQILDCIPLQPSAYHVTRRNIFLFVVFSTGRLGRQIWHRQMLCVATTNGLVEIGHAISVGTGGVDDSGNEPERLSLSSSAACPALSGAAVAVARAPAILRANR